MQRTQPELGRHSCGGDAVAAVAAAAAAVLLSGHCCGVAEPVPFITCPCRSRGGRCHRRRLIASCNYYGDDDDDNDDGNC